MSAYLGCRRIESRLVSGQMANMTVFSAIVDWRNRVDRRREPQRIRLAMNNHIGKGGHLSSQPMGALRDYIARDPATERPAVVNFPVRGRQPLPHRRGRHRAPAGAPQPRDHHLRQDAWSSTPNRSPRSGRWWRGGKTGR